MRLYVGSVDSVWDNQDTHTRECQTGVLCDCIYIMYHVTIAYLCMCLSSDINTVTHRLPVWMEKHQEKIEVMWVI